MSHARKNQCYSQKINKLPPKQQPCCFPLWAGEKKKDKRIKFPYKVVLLFVTYFWLAFLANIFILPENGKLCSVMIFKDFHKELYKQVLTVKICNPWHFL